MIVSSIEVERKRWICSSPRVNARLHALRERDLDAGTITTMCGQTFRMAFLARPWDQEKLRCPRCCSRTQMPEGQGSPVMDRACRIAAGWPPDAGEM